MGTLGGCHAMVVFPLQKRPWLGSLLMRDQSTRARFLPLDKKGYIETQNDKMRFCDPKSTFSQPVRCESHCLSRGRLTKSDPYLWAAASATNLFILCCDLGLGVGG